jgi:hypothetical protein
MDSISHFFAQFHTKEFIPGSSQIVDYVNGMAVYDSVFVESNTMWYLSTGSAYYLGGVGYINNEDSLYTMILPTNTAWQAAYAERAPYFVTSAANADSLQHLNTGYSIIQDLVFRGRIDNPAALDTLLSTQNNVFRTPSTLFSSATPYTASNGLVYITDNLNYNHWESWQHPLTVESELGSFVLKEKPTDVAPSLSAVYLPDKPDIPSKYCVRISYGQEGTKNANTVIFFDVPNTLKATYNVYAVFAPMRYKELLATGERTRIRYDIQQLDRATMTEPADRQVWKTLIAANVNGAAPDDTASSTANKGVTDSIAVKKMLLRANFTLPEANYNEKTTTIRIKLISLAVTSSADRNGGFNNRMLLDKIVFEPVH